MTAVERFSVRTVVFEDGERMPMLVRAHSGMPVFDACVYAVSAVRPASGSSATIEQALRGVQVLLTFTGNRGIDLHERFATGQFLDVHELDELVRAAYSPLATKDKNQLPLTSPKIISLERVRKRTPKATVESDVAISTAAIRLYYARTYLEWLGRRTVANVCKTLEQRSAYMALLGDFLSVLSDRTPVARSESDRLSLTAPERETLLRVIDPGSPDNPWTGEFVRDRNRLLVMWGMGTGLRRGELLNLGIKLIDFTRSMADIVRQHDSKKDPRKYQPNPKTRERRIGISKELARLTHEHVVKYRSKIRGARKHDFLFVADTGAPLSLAAVSKIYRALRNKHPSVGDRLSSHVLRHTWNEDFSEIADRSGLSEDDERRGRIHAMGWSSTSTAAEHYLKRRTRRVATEASVKIQQSIISGTEDGDHDR
jgi:integrase